MRLVIVCHEFLPIGGGGSVVTYQLARALAASDEVEVLTAGYADLPAVEEMEGFRVRRLAVRRRSSHGSGLADMASFVRAGAKDLTRGARRHDAALAIFSLPAGLVTLRALGRTGLPYLAYLGGSDVPGHDPTRFRLVYPLVRPLVRRVWRRAYKVVACSAGLRDLARASDARVPIDLVPDGVDTRRFLPRQTPREPGPVRVLFVGRLVRRKACDVLLAGFARARSLGADASLVVVGDGPERGALESLAAELGLKGRVSFAGTVPYAELPQTLAAADLFVLPSLAEGMACIVLEAMGAGLPVLATRVAGNDEIVHGGDNGELVAAGDVEALGRSLAALVSKGPVELSVMGRRSRELVLAYDWQAIAARYRVLLEAAAHARELKSGRGAP